MPKRTILLVEDDFDIRDTIAGILEEEGFAVMAVGDGREALDWLDANVTLLPCLVLLDMTMPVMDGRSFMAELRKNAAYDAVQVLLLTAGDELDGAARDLGAQGALRKPVRLAQLMSVVQHHCAGLGDAVC